MPSARHCVCQTLCLPVAVCQTVWQRAVCQTVWQIRVCQTPSTRHCLPDAVWHTVWQTALCQTVWQTPRLADTASARRRLPDTASARRHLADAVSSRQCLAEGRLADVCLIPSCRRCLPDAAMPDAVCQTVWQMWRLPDAVCLTLSAGRRRVWQRAICQTQRLADSVCQMPSARRPYARLSGRHRLPDTASARCGVWQAQCLADDVWQTLSAWYRLADAACRTPRSQTPSATLCLPDAVCHAAISQIPSARRPSGGLSGRRRLNWS